jgi:biopolymer transport protein TolR
VIRVLPGAAGQRASLKINQENTTWGNIAGRLHSIFADRAEKVVFIQGDGDVTFDNVAEVIDLAHSAGIDNVGLITAKMEARR